METSGALGLRPSGWTGFDKVGGGGGGRDQFLRFSRRCAEGRPFSKVDFPDSRSFSPLVRQRHRRDAEWRLLCSSYQKSRAAAIESESFHDSIDEAVILKEKAEEVRPYLCGRCIYLVGMMGSGKTTVGKILSEAVGYSFFDSDKLVEQAAGGTSVAQIFKEHSEDFFRDAETNVLRDLSSMRRLVVATGGGVVIRPNNWRYMKQGITVWLDVPLDALARRIAAVGTASRPLLHQESGDPYTKALNRLRLLWEERGEAYTNADAVVSLQYMAAKRGQGDVNKLTPTAIAVEALVRIGDFLSTSQLEMHASKEEA